MPSRQAMQYKAVSRMRVLNQLNFLSTIAVVVITYYTSLIRLATTAELMVNYQRLFYSEKLIAAERWCIDLIAYISINT